MTSVPLQSIIDALRFFGPLSPRGLAEALRLRGETYSPDTIAAACELDVTARPGGVSRVRIATDLSKVQPGSLDILYKL